MDKSFSKMKSFPHNGAFDFDDGADSNVEYTYNANGQLTSDANSGISFIQYDMLGNPKKVTMASGDYIEYVYAPDGTKLKASHYTKRTNNTYSCLNTFYRGNMILESNCANLVQNSLGAIEKTLFQIRTNAGFPDRRFCRIRSWYSNNWKHGRFSY